MLSAEKRIRCVTSFALDFFALTVLCSAAIYFVQRYGEAYLKSFYEAAPHTSKLPFITNAPFLDYLLIVCSTLTCLLILGYYRLEFFTSFSKRMIVSIKASLLALTTTALCSYFLPMRGGDRLSILATLLAFLAFHALKNYLHRLADRRRIQSGITSNCLLVTTPEAYEKDVALLHEQDFNAVNFSAIYFVGQPDKSLFDNIACPHAINLEEARSLIKNLSIELITLRFNSINPTSTQEILDTAYELGLDVWFFSDMLLGQGRRFEFDRYMGLPMIIYRSSELSPVQLYLKRIIDIFTSASALVALLPLFACITLAVRLDSEGPIFFVQERNGLRGKRFRMLKFRTMHLHAETMQQQLMQYNEMSGPIFKLTNDPRITRMGKFLRRYSLDELPQLINVLNGEMSLVGPRPLPVHETMAFPRWKDRRRMTVKPGMTGLWQVSGRSDCNDFSELVMLDLKYIDKWNLLLDFEILLKTIPAVVSGKGAK